MERSNKQSRVALAMDTNMENRIGELAYPLWESAARPYGMAVDFWLMAEKMVLEVMTVAAKSAEITFRDVAPPPFGEPWPPERMPVERVRELAYAMWESAGRQQGMALDFWLSAQKHVFAMAKASTQGYPFNEMGALAREYAAMPAHAYLEQVRMSAYALWQAAGGQCDRALDFWLQAEKQLLATLCEEPPAAETNVGGPAAATSLTTESASQGSGEAVGAGSPQAPTPARRGRRTASSQSKPAQGGLG